MASPPTAPAVRTTATATPTSICHRVTDWFRASTTGITPALSNPLPMGFFSNGDGVVAIGSVNSGIAVEDGGGVDDVPDDLSDDG